MSNSLDFLDQSSETVAPRLLGCLLVRQLNGRQLVGKIVETEAYDQTDAASHSYRGETPRTSVMFGPSGFLYVYFTYGMHYCCNVVVGKAGHGAAVLIRAIEPLEGLDIMEENRHGRTGVDMTNGPAKLCQALRIDKTANGADLHEGSITLVAQPELSPSDIIQTTRIGIRHAADTPWRFYIKNNEYVSKKV